MTAPSSRPEPNSPRSYGAIKEISKELLTPAPALIALLQGRDPFFSGSEPDLRDAHWFTALWRQYCEPGTKHLRRLHYILWSLRTITLPDGSDYENTTKVWEDLNDASRHACYQGLVPPDALIDQRNPPPHLFATSRATPEPECAPSETPFWFDGDLPAVGRVDQPCLCTLLPSLRIDAPGLKIGALPRLTAWNHDYSEGDQAFHLEVWCEKSTVDDILLPVCQEFGANLVTSVGFQSISGIIALLKRAVRHGKPVRVFYVSDYDHAGSHMPPAVARQIEFWLPRYPYAADIKLMPVALTKEEVDAYDLPNRPGDKKRGNQLFEARQGRGVVKLDALQALHSGALAQTLREALEPYYDRSLRQRLREAKDEAEGVLQDEWEAIIQEAQEDLDIINDAASLLVEQFREQASELDAERDRTLEAFAPRIHALEAELVEALQPYTRAAEDLREQTAQAIVPLQERLDLARHAAQGRIGAFDPDLPDRPEAETEECDESDWLFDSGREYLEQLPFYKQNGGAE